MAKCPGFSRGIFFFAKFFGKGETELKPSKRFGLKDIAGMLLPVLLGVITPPPRTWAQTSSPASTAAPAQNGATAKNGAPAQNFREVVDEPGRTVRIPQPVMRIVSLAPSLTETIYALGLQDRLMATLIIAIIRPRRRRSRKLGARSIRVWKRSRICGRMWCW